MPDADFQAKWLSLAQQALKAYALTAAQLDWLAYTHHVVLHVRAAEGHFILRMSRESVLSGASIYGETQWLQFIQQHSALSVPVPVATLTGEHSTSLKMETETVHCVLFHYLEGEIFSAEALTPHQMYLSGQLLADLHQVSRAHPQQVAHLQPFRPRLDWQGLFGAGSVYDPGAGAALFTTAQEETFAQVAAQVRIVMDILASATENTGIIHGDLLSKNILLNGNQLCALDFEYCGWGFYLYDMAPLLWQLRHRADYNLLEEALWAGYTANYSLSETQHAHLETFIAARHLASCRWIAGNVNNPAVGAKATQIISERTSEMQHFLRTGRLERKSQVL